jgi:hypothetical protein
VGGLAALRRSHRRQPSAWREDHVVGLYLSNEKLKIDQCGAIALAIEKASQAMEVGRQFAIGDLLLHVRHNFSKDEYSALTKKLSYTPASLRNFVWVAKKVPPSLRNDGLDYHHYVAVAPLKRERSIGASVGSSHRP